MHVVDAIFLLLLFVVQPIYGAYSYNKFLSDIASGKSADRVSEYRQTMIMEWCAMFVLLLAWLLLGRPFSDLGFVSSSPNQVWHGVRITAVLVAVILLGWQYTARSNDEKKLKQREALGGLIHFLPQSNRDYNYFVGLSFTAGIVEEIIYRGFLFWVLSLYMPIWAAAIVSSIGFGLAHSYQGAGGVVKVIAAGLLFAWIYVATGSIWFPILAHILMDVLQAASIRELFKTRALA